MKLLLATDAWMPQINGVVRTLQTVCEEINKLGYIVEVLHPALFRTIPCPTYPEIRLAINAFYRLPQMIDAAAPDAIHICTEGPIGLAARRYCLRRGLPFTTSFHTKFPEYIAERFYVSARYGYCFMRWFHAPAMRMLVATPSLMQDLELKGFRNCQRWTRGVDTRLFHPDKRSDMPFERPIQLYVGRVAIEKNIEAFLSLETGGTKLVVGDGPQRAQLEARYPQARFAGAQHGEALAQYYASADVLVFPSLTDTFGLVMLEALASGTPVAAFPVTGPIDVITDPSVGALDQSLQQAISSALTRDRARCRTYAEGYSWQHCATMLLDALAPISPASEQAA